MAVSGSSVQAQMTFTRVLASEWFKLRKQRSFFWTTLAALGVTLGLAILRATGIRDTWNQEPAAALGMAALMPSSGAKIAAFIFGLGLCIWLAQEFVSGSSILTVQAVARRGTIFAARLVLICIVSGLFAASVALIGAGSVAYFLGLDWMLGVLSISLFWANLGAAFLFTLAITLMYFGLVKLMRRSLPAVIVMAVLLFVVPILQALVMLEALPTILFSPLTSTPAGLMAEIEGSLHAAIGDGRPVISPTLSPAVAAGLLITWCFFFVGVAGWRFSKQEW